MTRKIFYVLRGEMTVFPIGTSRSEKLRYCEVECRQILTAFRSYFNPTTSDAKALADFKADTQKTAAFILLQEWLFEFYKNMLEANVTRFTIEFSTLDETSEFSIRIIDNGTKRIPLDKLGSYSIERALMDVLIERQRQESSLGGNRLGLVVAAHFLRTYGDGDLKLQVRGDGRPGAVVELSSSMRPSRRDYVLTSGENIAHTIIFQMKEGMLARADSADVALIESIGRCCDALMQHFHHPACSERRTNSEVPVGFVRVDAASASAPLSVGMPLLERMEVRSRKYWTELSQSNPALFTRLNAETDRQNRVLRGEEPPPFLQSAPRLKH